ncbi:MAG: hypothetical protein FJW39_24560 [Acidobacteria bacterium]|nr:hypothetical protein [Acidobacteriota bacterium]
MLLIAGGQSDPNLGVLAQAAEAHGVPIADLRIGAKESPAFDWDLDTGQALLGGKPIAVRGAFLRHDVFASLSDPRPEVNNRAMGWFAAVTGWLTANGAVRMFNRGMTAVAGNKPGTLLLARECGLEIPATWITNHGARIRSLDPGGHIAKPVAGGGYCHSLDQALPQPADRDTNTAMPAIVQRKLIAPEIRIYIIGRAAFAFEMRSESLDYRVAQDAQVIALPEVPPQAGPLRYLMARQGMDFGAADFKTDPVTGGLLFLELNTSPMFARFDYASDGALCAAMVRELLDWPV